MADNPYRGDRISTYFVGREEMLSELERTILRRGAICPIMGGRGIGKSAVSRKLEDRLAGKVTVVRVEGGVDDVVRSLEKRWPAFRRDDVVESLGALLRPLDEQRALLVLDEVERILADDRGIALLDNLRKLFEDTDGKFSVVVLGGTELRSLLKDSASPFLGKARVRVLTGLSRDETAQLVREPLGVTVSDEVIDSLWAETAGHPRVLQHVMEHAVDQWRAACGADPSRDLEPYVLDALVDVRRLWLESELYRQWWQNLRDGGQRTYRALLRAPEPLPRSEWVQQFGDDPVPWVEVLESTGVAAGGASGLLPRGSGFASWVRENHPERSQSAGPSEPALEAWLDTHSPKSFERAVVLSLARWARRSVEFPGLLLKTGGERGNNGFLSEHTLRLSALMALTQHDAFAMVEPEALSAGRESRSDLKLRAKNDTETRACLEFKIYQRNDYKTVVQQAISYAIPSDTFTAVIVVDRTGKTLEDYEAHCFEGAAPFARVPSAADVDQPVLCTEHTRTNAGSIRVWHFLLRLPAAR
jgi:type II secretory pathway predicted ATPase ExeA